MKQLLAGVAIAAITVVMAHPANAQTDKVQRYAIPAQDLAAALKTFARVSGREIVAPSAILTGKRSAAAIGTLAPEQALARLLAGTGLSYRIVGGALIIESASVGLSSAQSDRDDIVVTGTQIAGAQPAGAHVITIDRKAIEQSGYSTTAQILKALPQNFGGGPNQGTVGFTVRNNASTNFGFGSSVNLRGLGATSTLVLVDGNRPPLGGGSGTFVDLSLIPSTAIDRIEVLADGASAIYGSDAVAGVVNVRLRNDFTGVEARLRYGAGNGFDEVQASELVGADWKSGHVTLGYEFYRRGRLSADDRAYATEDLRAFGGSDHRADYSNPATIVAANGQIFGVPHGQDGTGLQASALEPGIANRADGRAGTDLLPRLKRHSLYAAIEQDITNWLSFRGEGFFADRHSSDRYFPSNYGGVVVTPVNPFYVDPIGTREPITVHYDFRADLGPVTNLAHVVNRGAAGSLIARLGRWRAELHGTYGDERETESTINLPNYYRLALALADPDPVTAYNLFGDGSFTNRATIDTVRGSASQVGRSRIGSAALKFEGPLFVLPGGDARLAIGGEYRHERFAYRSMDDEFSAAPEDAGNAGFPLGRSIWAGYGELLLPLVAPAQKVPAIDKLDLSIAGRIEHYSDFGSTANPRLGLSWRPVKGITLRGTWGTSFRAPSFIDTRQGPGLSQFVPLPLPDPQSPTGSTIALALFGNRPRIKPETARTWTAGIDVAPLAAPGLSLHLTYFDVAYRDRIESLGGEYYSFLAERDRFGALIDDHPAPATIAAYYADPNFVNPFGIAASDVAIIIDGRTANLARVTQRGLDFDLGYRRKVGRAHVELGASGTYLFSIDERVTASAPSSDVVSTIGNPVDLRVRGRAIASLGKASFAGFVNFVDGYVNNAVSPAQKVTSWTTVDLRLGVALDAVAKPLKGTRLALSVTNVFDRAPPYVENVTPFSASGFDPENASAMGRVVAIELVKSW